MKNDLTIVTNGDAAANHLRELGFEGAVIPWRDVLYDGPVYPADNPDARIDVRAEFLSSCGWGQRNVVAAQLSERNQALQAAAAAGKLLLLFECDLCDALQILEIRSLLGPAEFSLVLTDEFVISAGARDLERVLEGETLARSDIRRELAGIWTAFCGANPFSYVAALQAMPESRAPLRKAFFRLLEEFPGLRDGISRSERQILHAVAGGASSPRAVFSVVQKLEEQPYAGDWSIWRYLERLTPMLIRVSGGEPFKRSPLSNSDEFFSQTLEITELGQAVLNGGADYLRMQPAEKWIGGAHLSAERTIRWDGANKMLTLRGGVL